MFDEYINTYLHPKKNSRIFPYFRLTTNTMFVNTNILLQRFMKTLIH